MYNTPGTVQHDSATMSVAPSMHDDAQFVVADVLSSMATGVIPADAKDYTESDDVMDISTFAPSLLTSAATLSTMTGTTPTSAPSASPWGFSNQMNSIPNDNFIHGGGFTPPVITNATSVPIVTRGVSSSVTGGSVNNRSTANSDRSTRSNSSSPAPSLASDDGSFGKVNMSLTGPLRRKIPDNELTAMEREKRKVRRERNKLAAAKCRQKRVDQTNELVTETEVWEEKNATLQNEIAKLEKQKEQLEFLLQAHKPMCRVAQNNAMNVFPSTTFSSPVTSTFTPSQSKSNALETPTTEVVTPTSSLFTFTIDTDTLPSSSLIGSTASCGSEATKDS
ncbi:fos-related antigen 2-like isoform X2 [Ptychodera flava]|uniref:fos-related antigen 2-like isoform X2 n=1 Tax=Ptychodera flava TaxID=63121 RepID=UPI00396A2BAA